MLYTHSKVISVFIICFALILSTVFYKKNKEVQAKKDALNLVTLVKIDSKNSDVDTDLDGLKDWEEGLLGTDPLNMDTDRDGTNDKQEVDLNRDPKIPGPKDLAGKTTYTEPATTISPTSTINSNNLTENLAQGFMSYYIETKASGEPLSTVQATAIAQKTLNSASFDLPPDKYTLNDIKISKNQTKDNYRKEIENILLYTGTTNIKENEVTIMMNAFKSQKESELAKIEPIIKNYSKTIEAILKVTVPVDMAGIHLIGLNSMNGILENLKDMRNIMKDPTKGYIAFQIYNYNAMRLKIVMKKYSTYFSLN